MVQVPYKELAVFINISDTSHWFREGGPQQALHPTIRPGAEGDARWWIPDVDVSKEMINVSSPGHPSLPLLLSPFPPPPLLSSQHHNTRDVHRGVF